MKERACTEVIDAFVVPGPVRQSMANISCWFASADWSHGYIHNLGRRLESRSPPIWKGNGMVLANCVIVIHRLFAWSLVRDAFQDIASFLSREHKHIRMFRKLSTAIARLQKTVVGGNCVWDLILQVQLCSLKLV